MEFLAKIGGRKFLTALVGVVAVALGSAFGIPEAAVLTVGGVVVTYIYTEGRNDKAKIEAGQ